jgi:hypothetical protein
VAWFRPVAAYRDKAVGGVFVRFVVPNNK